MNQSVSLETSKLKNPYVSRFLLVESGSPVRLDLEMALQHSFPTADIQHFYCEHSVDWPEWLGQGYDLVIVRCDVHMAEAAQWLESIRQVDKFNRRRPLLVLMLEQHEVQDDWFQVADLCLSSQSTASELALRMVSLLTVRRVLQDYPLHLPGWKLLEVLHNSDNAVIFLAEQAQGQRAVIKRFKFAVKGVDRRAFASFIADTNSLARLQPPGLVKMLSAGVSEDAVYLLMEYVEGENLKQILADLGKNMGEQDTRQLLSWFRQIAETLGVLHALSMLHRDLKTSNIFIRSDGTPVLLDFGIEGRLLLDTGFLREDEIYCTPFYVSPERITGEPASVQSDLYALGVLLYELLLGEKPYLGSSLAEVLQKHVFDPIPQLPVQFAVYQPLIDRLLAKSPEWRMQSVDEVLTCLDTLESSIS